MRDKSPLGDSLVCANHTDHTGLRGEPLNRMAAATGDMCGWWALAVVLRGEDTKFRVCRAGVMSGMFQFGF